MFISFGRGIILFSNGQSYNHYTRVTIYYQEIKTIFSDSLYLKVLVAKFSK